MIARFEATDKAALAIATLLIVGGFFALLLPQDFTFGRATNFPKNRQETLIETSPLGNLDFTACLPSSGERVCRVMSYGPHALDEATRFI